MVLNSNCAQVGGCGAGSPQETWLRADLAAHPTTCTLAYWHHPRFSFGKYSNDPHTQALWQALYDAGAEIVLSGHDHNYQRYAPADPDGTLGSRRAASGSSWSAPAGKNHYPLGTPPANVEASNDDTFGILQLTLHADQLRLAVHPRGRQDLYRYRQWDLSLGGRYGAVCKTFFRRAMAARRRSYSWTVDHPGWVVTLDSLEEQSVFNLGSPPSRDPPRASSLFFPMPAECASACVSAIPRTSSPGRSTATCPTNLAEAGFARGRAYGGRGRLADHQ